MPRIILFRTPTKGDSYADEFASRGYTATSIRTLDERLDPKALLPYLDAERWEGVVITSRRAAEAWVLATRMEEESPAQSSRDCESEMSTLTAGSKVPFYAPGGAVGSVLSQLPDPPVPITAISAASLVPLVLDAQPRGERYRPYLLLVGDKSLPTIPEALKAAGREYTRVQVYETCEAASLEEEIKALRLERGDWVGLFSPSSAECVGRYLDFEGVKVAAIGETTAKGVRVDAVAESPDALGLAEAVAKADGGR